MSFSIVIPVFNEKKNIPLLISKILYTLKKRKYEIIIVDDSSTDGSKEVLLKLKKKIKHLMVLLNV